MSKVLNIFGLLLNLVGLVLLFLVGMPFRISTGVQSVTWTTANLNVQVKNLEDLSGIVGWIGLSTIVLGTLLQILASMRRPW